MASYYWGEVLCWKHKRKSRKSTIRRKLIIFGKYKYNSRWPSNIGERPLNLMFYSGCDFLHLINTFNFNYIGFPCRHVFVIRNRLVSDGLPGG